MWDNPAAGPGTIATLTCGSVIVRTETGQVEAVLDNGQIVVTIPAEAMAEVSDTANGATVENVTGVGVTISSNDVTTTIPPGTEPVNVNSWVLDGFRAPVDNPQVLNLGKAGRAVPLKWHLTDAGASRSPP